MSDLQVVVPTMVPPVATLPEAPAVIIPTFEWRRDPGVSDLIEYLDQYDEDGVSLDEKWAKLTSSEQKQILDEVDRCRRDFTYAARNYFKISDKNRQDILFKLWEAQELILERIMWLRARGLPQKLLIIKARQLGCSTLLEAIIAWRACFFTNVNGLVVSYSPEHAAYLFGIMLNIYNQLPWWMRPMAAGLKYEEGLVLANPKHEERRKNPGLNSRVDVDAASKMTGVGTGKRLSVVHASEFAKWPEDKARRIIETDLVHALADNAETLAVLESTAEGAGTFAHKLWNKSVDLGDNSKWIPIFLPSFFDKQHFVAPPLGWQPREEEVALRERARKEWLRCDFRPCQQPHMTHFQQRDRTGETCPTCNVGTLHEWVVDDGFLRWMELQKANAGDDEESKSNLKQEQPISAEEAFQISGNPVFGSKGMEWMNSTIREPIARCFITSEGIMHGVDTSTGKCVVSSCGMDHRKSELPIRVFEWPVPDGDYYVGADPASGDGQDSSAGSVYKKPRGYGLGEQVLVYQSNTVETIKFARDLNMIGRLYNDACVAPEINRYDTVATYLAFQLAYPNIYRMRSLAQGTMGTVKGIGWHTHVSSKPRLYICLRNMLNEHLVAIRDRATVEEAKTFVKDVIGGSVEAAKSFHDDLIVAAQISVYIAHERDWDENMGTMMTRTKLTMDTAMFHMTCRRCAFQWPTNNLAEEASCPQCHSMQLAASRNGSVSSNPMFSNNYMNPEREVMSLPAEEKRERDYDTL